MIFCCDTPFKIHIRVQLIKMRPLVEYKTQAFKKQNFQVQDYVRKQGLDQHSDLSLLSILFDIKNHIKVLPLYSHEEFLHPGFEN